MITDNSVRIVRVRLRNRFAMTKPLLVMGHLPLKSGRLLKQLPLLQMQGATRELGRLRIVGHDDNRLAVLAVQELQQAEDLVRGLAVEVARGLVAHEQLGVRNQRPRDRDALLLPAGELRGLCLRAIGETDHL